MLETAPRRELPCDDRLPFEISSVARAVIDFQSRCGTWSGTALELLSTLRPPTLFDADFWPATPHKLTRRITKAEPLLECKGVVFIRVGCTSVGTPVFKICAVADLVTAPQEAQADA